MPSGPSGDVLFPRKRFSSLFAISATRFGPKMAALGVDVEVNLHLIFRNVIEKCRI